MNVPLVHESHRDPSCDAHLHCPECGLQLSDDGSDVVVCVDCDTDAPIGARTSEAVAS